MPDYIINPLGAPFDAVRTVADLGLDALYARLDGSNEPFTGAIAFSAGLSVPDDQAVTFGTDSDWTWEYNSVLGHVQLESSLTGVSIDNYTIFGEFGDTYLPHITGSNVIEVACGPSLIVADRNGTINSRLRVVNTGYNDETTQKYLELLYDSGTDEARMRHTSGDLLIDTLAGDLTLDPSANLVFKNFTGFLQATSGVVSAAAIGTGDLPSTVMLEGENVSLLTNDAGYLTTVDISDDTNLAVSAPITLTDDTVGLDVSASIDWTGDHDFQGALQKDGLEVNAPQNFNGTLSGFLTAGSTLNFDVSIGRSDFRTGRFGLRGQSTVSASNGFVGTFGNIRPGSATGAISTLCIRGAYSSTFYVVSAASRASDDMFGGNIYLRNVYFNGATVRFVFVNGGVSNTSLSGSYNFTVW